MALLINENCIACDAGQIPEIACLTEDAAGRGELANRVAVNHTQAQRLRPRPPRGYLSTDVLPTPRAGNLVSHRPAASPRPGPSARGAQDRGSPSVLFHSVTRWIDRQDTECLRLRRDGAVYGFEKSASTIAL